MGTFERVLTEEINNHPLYENAEITYHRGKARKRTPYEHYN
jgi:hypothetical protein